VKYNDPVTTTVDRPFGHEVLDEVPLNPAPLVRVLAELRYPRVVSLTSDKSLGAFQDAIRSDFPVMRQLQTQGITVGPAGAMIGETSVVNQFASRDGAWTVALSQESLSLGTTAYSSRSNFVERFLNILVAVDQVSSPGPISIFDRLGIRYTNRLQGEDAERSRLRRLVRSEVYGALTIADGLKEGQELVSSITQQEYDLGTHKLVARWASLPPGGAIAPDVEPTSVSSWILDVDAFVDGEADFDPTAVAELAEQGAVSAYHLFRWAMTASFINERAATS
jgi:uncharacterized protein (TIGR04255 family)